MSFLQTILAFAGGALAGPAAGKLLNTAIELLNSPQVGGLSGLVQAFKDKGLGELAASWISTGKNLSVTGEEVQSVLGQEQIQKIAQALGITNQNVSAGLAGLLPELIDMLTPDGQLPQAETVAQKVDELKTSLNA
jgi:uncharacterized protein YidB (DUF937 family)